MLGRAIWGSPGCGGQMNKSLLENALRQQIAALIGLDFQSIIIELLRIEHGANKITTPRESGDKGADCLVNIDVPVCIACYAPDTLKARGNQAVLRKIRGDYDKYEKYWKSDFAEWHFYTVLSLAPEFIRQVTRFGQHCRIFGDEDIRARILAISRGKALPLFAMLKIDKSLVARDLLQVLFDDLIEEKITWSADDVSAKAPIIEEKIRANSQSNAEADFFRSILLDTVMQQQMIQATLQAYNNNEITAIKHQAKRLFTKFVTQDISGFQKIQLLTEHLQARYNPGEDSEIQLYIDAFAYYLFGQCLIGEKPASLSGEACDVSQS